MLKVKRDTGLCISMFTRYRGFHMKFSYAGVNGGARECYNPSIGSITAELPKR